MRANPETSNFVFFNSINPRTNHLVVAVPQSNQLHYESSWQSSLLAIVVRAVLNRFHHIPYLEFSKIISEAMYQNNVVWLYLTFWRNNALEWY